MITTDKTDQEHLEHPKNVLKRRKARVWRPTKKCEFFKDRVTFCGRAIDRESLHKTQQKIEAVVCARKPENVSQLRSFAFPRARYLLQLLPSLRVNSSPPTLPNVGAKQQMAVDGTERASLKRGYTHNYIWSAANALRSMQLGLHVLLRRPASVRFSQTWCPMAVKRQ